MSLSTKKNITSRENGAADQHDDDDDNSIAEDDGFDFWRSEFAAQIHAMEDLLRKQQSNQKKNDDGNSDKDSKRIRKLLKSASSSLKQLQGHISADVTPKDSRSINGTQAATLQQRERQDMYNACQMQLQTYKVLYQQHQLFANNGSDNVQADDPETTACTDSNGDSSISSSPLWNSATTSRQRQIQQSTQGKVLNQNLRLQDALRSVRESQEIAQGTLEELASQRDTLQSTQASTRQLQDMTQHANGLIKSMNKKWWQKW